MNKALSLLLMAIMLLSTAYASASLSTQRIFSERSPGKFIEIETVEIEEDLVQLIISSCNEAICMDSFRKTMTTEELAERLENTLDENIKRNTIMGTGSGLLASSGLIVGMTLLNNINQGIAYARPANGNSKMIGGIIAITAISGIASYSLTKSNQKGAREFIEAINESDEDIHLKNASLRALYNKLQLILEE